MNIYAKIVENWLLRYGRLFSGPQITSMASKVTFACQKALFARPEVTTFLPEVKIVKPEVRPKHVHKTFMYSNLFVSTLSSLRLRLNVFLCKK